MLKKMKKGFTLIELMIVVTIIGILAAIAIPNFIKFQARSKQSEAKANLKAMFTTEKAFFQEKDRYSTLVNEVGYAPERNNRYAYYLDTGGTHETRTGTTPVRKTTDSAIDVDTFKYPGGLEAAADTNPSALPCAKGSIGITGTGPYTFVGAAQGNIDSDATLDFWSISTDSRDMGTGSTTCEGGNSPSGEPFNEFNDVNRG